MHTSLGGGGMGREVEGALGFQDEGLGMVLASWNYLKPFCHAKQPQGCSIFIKGGSVGHIGGGIIHSDIRYIKALNRPWGPQPFQVGGPTPTSCRINSA